MKRLVIGVLAHVDSGKTTLLESILYKAGTIKKLGRVDHGDAFLDTFNLEKDRGITIFSKQAVVDIDDVHITLLDTPGHVDFSTEMERTLQVLDYAILVISATDGVQSHTETLWRLLSKHKIKTFIFVNKMDLAGANRSTVLENLSQKLSHNCIDFTSDNTSEQFYERVAMSDEKLFDNYLKTGSINQKEICDGISNRNIFPCYFGSALKLDGIEKLINGICSYTNEPCFGSDFGAKVYKIARDVQGNRLSYLKITGGCLKVREVLTGTDRLGEEWHEKVNHVRIYSGAKYSAVEEAFAGDICAVTGLTHTYPGEGLGNEKESEMPILEPVLTYKVILPDNVDVHTVLVNLRILEEEDPQLHVVWNELLQEIHVQLMGEVQLQILKSIVAQRFNIDIDFDNGNIVYKETITDTVEGVGHFEPLRHYAEVHLVLSPCEKGSGLLFCNECSEDILDKNWQRLIMTHLEEKLHRGVLTGSPITDIKIVLSSGKAHEKHTEGGDFRQATYRAVRQGLRKAKSVLLEPWYSFKLEVPNDNIGRAMADIQKMNGDFSAPKLLGEMSILEGSAPVASMRGYSNEVVNYTRGKGRLSCILKGYEECHDTNEVIEKIGYNCDADIENTADSVFCSHGAGFVVKWDKVCDFMHLESVLEKKTAQGNIQIVHSAKKITHLSSIEQDKELLSIYEHTYGPIKHRDTRQSMLSVRKAVVEKEYRNVEKQLSGPEYLLVDGYNIIFAWDELKKIAAESLDSARERLIDVMCSYQAFHPCELILVFDAYKVKGNTGSVQKVNNINVVYTKEAETADMYIEKVTHKIARENRVRVATSDGIEQLIILSHGALRISASAFCDEVNIVKKNIEEYLTN